jgi:hypothetical protein
MSLYLTTLKLANWQTAWLIFKLNLMNCYQKVFYLKSMGNSLTLKCQSRRISSIINALYYMHQKSLKRSRNANFWRYSHPSTVVSCYTVSFQSTLGLLSVLFSPLVSEQIELQIRRLHTVVVQLESPTLENEGATGLVYQALACAPRPLPPNTQTASALFIACKCLQQRLTSNFHEEYESAMTGGGGTGTTSEQRDPGRMWAVFVATASPRLLSVLLAALLPAALSESRLGECLFRAALDAALTPLWSRFYFHLERALEDGSSQQILWTFRYARSHVKMLAALAAQVATHPCLEALGLQVDWAQAARAGIADKTCVFLRAHVAKVLSPLPQSPPQQHQHQQSLVASTAGLQLIEEALESDRCLCTVHGGPLGPAERVTGVLRDHPEVLLFFLSFLNNTELTLTLCDHPQARRLWREVDRHFFLGTLTEACLPGSQQPASQAFSSSNAPDPFENKSYPIDDQRLRVRSGLSIAQSKSSTIFPLSIACALVSGRSHNSSSSSSNHCDINADLPRHVFCAVFEGVHLLSLACRRYYWTDVQTQKLFSEAVVEPLLAALLGI